MTQSSPLSGIRVLDLTRILAGPWAVQNLADLGAEVIKVEKPLSGDDTRHFGPPFIHDDAGAKIHAAYFLACNRGKKSVTIDISTHEGQGLIRALVAQCDVLVENFKVGALAKFGLDYESLRKELPDLIYCSITGFGQTGPYAKRPGYDTLIQGMGGLMSVTGERDDKPGGGPQRVGVAVSDLFTGMYAALAVLAALRHREHGGGGQHIDIAMLDVQVGLLVNQSINYLTTGVVPTRVGNGHPNIAPYQAFAAADGHVILAIGNDQQYERFCRSVGRADLATDPRYGTSSNRLAHVDSLIAEMNEITRCRTVDEWVAAMEAVGVPCGPINTIDRVFADPQVQARNMLLTLKHARAGSVPSIANPMRFSATPIRYDRVPPMLGEHSEEVLSSLLGLGPAEIEHLQETAIVGRYGQPDPTYNKGDPT
ncbi:CoA-transferase [Achromobacter piechaudii]|uniref:CaiB/BaiF CoA transferase family protein n=1 Tax=Achromobacter piechaudii TaxID=72556 RepID=UPI000680C250|nr:CaiB/BaiF CoA-transferase family protein [Achromobacter piechaudii]KNY05683.1 CoA-transferase [Achromobacter piechaudii]CAB3925220.1 Acetyl-CoA:oxalate CoA-transferase [Achromobacter piechaudii]CAB3955730.1 Acetyl-CoA:oxalate CoA-transferase [Achromobacter piechaudii]